MLGGEVVSAVFLLSPNKHQGVDGEDPIPERRIFPERYEVLVNVLSYVLASFLSGKGFE